MDKQILLSKNLGLFAPGFFSRKLKRPVFIIGSGRSGTTMLAEILRKHEDIAVFPGEANEFWHIALYPYHLKNVDVPPIWLSPAEYTKKSISLWPSNWGKKLRSIFGALQFTKGKPVFLNKTVMVNFMLKEVVEIFPDAKFIYLVRNGWSVALSYQKKEVEKYSSPRYKEYEAVTKDEKKIRLAHAKYWNDTVLEVEAKKKELFNADNFYELRYEHIGENPAKEIEKLLGFIGLKMSKTQQFTALVNKIENRNNKVKEGLSDVEIQELRSVMQEGLRVKGYEDLYSTVK